MSIKAVTEEIFRKFTKREDAKQVLLNFKRYKEAGLSLRAESVLVPDLIDVEEIERIARFVSSVDPSIPYRIDGYIPERGNAFRRPTREELEEAKKRIERHLKNVSVLHYRMKPKYRVVRIY